MKILITILFSFLIVANDLDQARINFYKATEKEEYLELAIDNFEALKGKENINLCNVYLGSLTALRAKYSIWPNKMLKFANTGIDLMEKAIKEEPNNIEILFVYGTTCYYLPFFFEKSEAAEKSLLKILDLKKEYKKYDQEILKNAIKFIIDELKPEKKYLDIAKSYLKELDKK